MGLSLVTWTIAWDAIVELRLGSVLCRVLQAASSAWLRIVDSPIPTRAFPLFSKRVLQVLRSRLCSFGFERTSIIFFIIVAEICCLTWLASSAGI